jgi:hypothetical protein
MSLEINNILIITVVLAGVEIIRLGNKALKVCPQYTRKMNLYNRLV